ncbi:methyltransferase [Streptomyces sp.]|uniref:methyltransferase n=1 Tax=Streptomyces sp. TaxID=1931 RepID=UPI002D5844C8|nr:methyltransferase [Streptomyces sp.]HZF89574.1 methyltransferase [Streptomyces sp.]
MPEPAPRPAALLDDYLGLVDDSCVALLPHVLRIAVELAVADVLGDGALGADEIAEAVGAEPDALYRLLRALASVGVLTEEGGHIFRLTPAGHRLRAGVPGSVRTSLLNVESQRAWLHGIDTFRTGRSVFDGRHGGFFAHKDADSASDRAFLQRMRERAARLYPRFATGTDWSESHTVMDIGGGDGYQLDAILRSAPRLRGVLFDRPAVVAAVREAGTFDGRDCELRAGDFFEGVPRGADTHLLCSVLHDWTDEQCVSILSSSRAALEPGGRLMIVEMLVPEDGSWHPSMWSDIGMMVLTGGRERTAAEFEALLTKAGYTLSAVRAVPDSDFSVLVAEQPR